MVNGLSEILVQLPLSQVTELVVSLLLVATLTTFHVSVSPPTSTTWVMIGYCVSGREREEEEAAPLSNAVIRRVVMITPLTHAHTVHVSCVYRAVLHTWARLLPGRRVGGWLV